jgi:hypothetical protein
MKIMPWNRTESKFYYKVNPREKYAETEGIN